MSQENVEIVRRSFAAYDSGGLDALAEFWHPDIDWRAVEGYIDDVGRIRGPDGLRQYYRQWEETFDAVRVEIEELTEAGDEVVALLRSVGRMKGSDAEIAIRYAVVHLDTRRHDRQGTGVLDPRGSPRSRRAPGVGDVAGERGDCPPLLGEICEPGHRGCSR
jgi:ketosteroid isomerase-like protein